jgi:hypothetical protein
MLELDPSKRITANEALDHTYFKEDPVQCDPKDLPKIEKDSHEFQSRQNKKQMMQNPKMDMIVAKHGYNNNPNPNYYNKNNLNDGKLKIEETRTTNHFIQTGNSTSFTTSNRLETLLISNNSNSILGQDIKENILLNNKRYLETSLDTESGHKKQRNNYSPNDKKN